MHFLCSLVEVYSTCYVYRLDDIAYMMFNRWLLKAVE